MATLTQLYARIILDTNRDDMGAGGELEQAKIDAVADAIEFHADELFWFNRKSGSASTAANAATVALPAGMRIPLVVTFLGAALARVPLEEIEARQNVSSETTGPPSRWAEDEGAIHLYPTPDAAYTLGVFGIAELGVPATANEWTTQAYELILNHAKIILCRGPAIPKGSASPGTDATRR
jgi:hypothetical protein